MGDDTGRYGNNRLGRSCQYNLLLLPLWPFCVASYWMKARNR